MILYFFFILYNVNNSFNNYNKKLLIKVKNTLIIVSLIIY
jgi:hypothetical protein